MDNLLSRTSDISEKLNEIAPLDFLREDPPDGTLTIVSLECEAGASPTSAESCNPVVRYPKHPDDLRKLAGIKSNTTERDFVSRMIFITQNHSFKPLNLTPETMKTLLDEHEVNPKFIETASSFCSKVQNIEDSLCMPFWMKQSEKYLEYMYIFKYPAQTSRAKRPWYLWQAAVYHQLRLSDRRSTYVMINPYADTEAQRVAMAWLLQQKTVSEARGRAFSLHDVLFSQFIPRHRLFAREFEEKVEILSMRMLSVGLRDIESVKPQDMADLNHVQVKLLPQPHALAGLKQVLEGLDRAYARWRKFQSFDTESLTSEWEDVLANQSNAIDAYKSNSEGIIQKCAVAAQLLTSILEFNNRSIADQQRRIASQQNTRASLLTQFAVNDSITVRVVTAISLVFLCAATVATILDTPFFDADGFGLQVHPSVWIYIVLTIALTCATLGYWRWNLSVKKRQRLQIMKRMNDHFDKLDETSWV